MGKKVELWLINRKDSYDRGRKPSSGPNHENKIIGPYSASNRPDSDGTRFHSLWVYGPFSSYAAAQGLASCCNRIHGSHGAYALLLSTAFWDAVGWWAPAAIEPFRPFGARANHARSGQHYPVSYLSSAFRDCSRCNSDGFGIVFGVGLSKGLLFCARNEGKAE